jgi:hypothetical protein
MPQNALRWTKALPSVIKGFQFECVMEKNHFDERCAPAATTKGFKKWRDFDSMK